MSSSFLIVGLGNPGKQYEPTRHNIGFMVADYFAAKVKSTFTRFPNIYWETSFEYDQKLVTLIKPATFMNLSGRAVAIAVEKTNIVLSNLLIICDDVNLAFGTIRIRSKGSDGGQKGLRSISAMLKTQDFPRLRIGIGDHVEDAVEYVLSPFSEDEKRHLPSIIQYAADTIASFITNGIELTMSQFNRNWLGGK